METTLTTTTPPNKRRKVITRSFYPKYGLEVLLFLITRVTVTISNLVLLDQWQLFQPHCYTVYAYYGLVGANLVMTPTMVWSELTWSWLVECHNSGVVLISACMRLVHSTVDHKSYKRSDVYTEKNATRNAVVTQLTLEPIYPMWHSCMCHHYNLLATSIEEALAMDPV